VRAAFAALVRLVGAGPLVACGDHAEVRGVIAEAVKPITYGFGADNQWVASDLRNGKEGVEFAATFRGKREAIVTLRLFGEMNVANALAVYALCRELGVDERGVRAGLSRYRGAARRQELIGEAAGITVVDDFAHHPTAIEETIAAIRGRFPGRSVRAVFEPRSNTSRRAVFQSRFAEALANADAVAVSAVYAKENDPLRAEEMLSTDRLVSDLRASGVDAWAAADLTTFSSACRATVAAGEVVLCMSNGSFANLPRRLLARLRERVAGAAV
jgi:UDP-N-acetylmuramate: L-alanyl-gamma-D-glutamyl-meso-diaminopimelate ligase